MMRAILTYHSIDSSAAVTSVDRKTFADQLEWLAKSGLRVAPLEEVIETGGVALTFDDGHRSFYDVALPLLERYGFAATLFAVSGWLGRAGTLSAEQLKDAARRGVSIGGHCVSHVDLTGLDATQVEREMADCQARLEDLTGAPVRALAYPYGRSTRDVRELARARFDFACGTRLAFLGSEDDRFDLPRLDVYYLRRRFWFRRIDAASGRAYLGAASGAEGGEGPLVYDGIMPPSTFQHCPVTFGWVAK